MNVGASTRSEHAAANTVAAIGEHALVEGFRLAGVCIHACRSDQKILSAWNSLPKATSVVILTPRSARVLESALSDPKSPMTVVLPS